MYTKRTEVSVLPVCYYFCTLSDVLTIDIDKCHSQLPLYMYYVLFIFDPHDVYIIFIPERIKYLYLYL